MGGGPPDFPQGSTCLVVLWILHAPFRLRLRGFHPLRLAFPKPFRWLPGYVLQSITPWCTHHGLGSSGFARRYSRNRVFFLFLRLLRCFSSPGSLPYVMDWRMDDGGLLRRVSPFRYPWITGYLLLPMAFRSLSRLSSALSAKASTLRSSSLNQAFFAASVPRLVQVVALLMKLNWFFKSYLMSFPMCSFQGTVCIAPCRSFSGFRHPLN